MFIKLTVFNLYSEDHEQRIREERSLINLDMIVRITVLPQSYVAEKASIDEDDDDDEYYPMTATALMTTNSVIIVKETLDEIQSIIKKEAQDITPVSRFELMEIPKK